MGIIDAIINSTSTFVGWLRENPIISWALFFSVLLVFGFVGNSITDYFIASDFRCGSSLASDEVQDAIYNSTEFGTAFQNYIWGLTKVNSSGDIVNVTQGSSIFKWWGQFWSSMDNYVTYIQSASYLSSTTDRIYNAKINNLSVNDIVINETIFNTFYNTYPPIMIRNASQDYKLNELFSFNCQKGQKILKFFSFPIFDWKLQFLIISLGLISGFALKIWYPINKV